MIIELRKKDTEIMPVKINNQWASFYVQVSWSYHRWEDTLEQLQNQDYILEQTNRLFFVRKLRQFKVDKTLITLFDKSVIESILSFCIKMYLLGREQFKRRPYKSRQNNFDIRKIHSPCPSSGRTVGAYYKKTLNKTISMSRYVEVETSTVSLSQ